MSFADQRDTLGMKVICRVSEEFIQSGEGFQWMNLSGWMLHNPSVKFLVEELRSAEILLHSFSWLSASVPP